MNKKLFKSIREYKKESILAPILVILEVLMEVLIPLEMAKIIDVGIANGDLGYIVQRGVILVIMAMLALFFGVQAGNMADMQKIFVMIFSTRYRIFPSKILTISPHRDWSHE